MVRVRMMKTDDGHQNYKGDKNDDDDVDEN